jgi:hypothetical protein
MACCQLLNKIRLPDQCTAHTHQINTFVQRFLQGLRRVHPADLDHKRIYDRVLSVTVPVRFAGVSLRVGEKQAGMDWMRGILG